MRWTWLGIALQTTLLGALPAQPCATQRVPFALGTAYTASGGQVWGAQRDEIASSLRFGGSGWVVALGVDQLGAGHSVSASLSGNVRNLTSSAVASTERLTGGTLDLMVLRRVFATSMTRRYDAGVDARTSMSFTEHRYGISNMPDATFAFGFSSIGAAAVARQRIAGGSAALAASMPLVAYVTHPYLGIKAGHLPLRGRLATVAEFRGLDAVASYHTGDDGRLGFRYEYRVNALRLDDAQPIRSINQTLSVGLVMHRVATKP